MNYKNNPLNIRFSKHNRWYGQIKPRNGFCQFETIDYGMRAAVIVLTTYINKGFNTPVKIINRFAPPFENRTADYIKFVCKDIIKSDTVISSIHSYEFFVLINRMARFESGFHFYMVELDRVIDLFKLPDVLCADHS